MPSFPRDRLSVPDEENESFPISIRRSGSTRSCGNKSIDLSAQTPPTTNSSSVTREMVTQGLSADESVTKQSASSKHTPSKSEPTLTAGNERTCINVLDITTFVENQKMEKYRYQEPAHESRSHDPGKIRPQTVVYVPGINAVTTPQDADGDSISEEPFDEEQPSYTTNETNEQIYEAELVTATTGGDAMIDRVIQRLLNISPPAQNVQMVEDQEEATKLLQKMRQTQRRRLACMGGLLFVLCGAAAVVATLFITRLLRNEGSTPTPTPTNSSSTVRPVSTNELSSSSPTNAPAASAPTIQPTTVTHFERETYFKDVLVPVLNASHLHDPQSAQYKAFQWLLLEDSFGIELNSELIERFVVLIFYFSTDGPNWTRQYNFLAADAHHCSWTAPDEEVQVIVCSDNRIAEIDLRLNNLGGSIPAELQYMPMLKRLYLQENDLRGPLPSEIGSLARLMRLDLNNNFLQGTIPSFLFGLQQLRAINLESNSITGTIPDNAGDCSDLKALSLSENQLTGELPSSLNKLIFLEELRVDGNVELEGPIPPFSVTRNLKYLSLGNNKLTGTIPITLFENRHLITLSAYQNLLVGTLPTEIRQLTRLKYLNVGNNQLTGPLPVFPTAPNLTRVGLNYNKFTGSIEPLLGGAYPKLEFFRVDFNMLTGSLAADTIGEHSILKQFEISKNPLSGTIPTEVGLLTLITALDMSETQFEGTIPTELGALTAAELFRVDGNSLGGAIPSELGELTQLTKLNVCCNALMGNVPTELSQLSELVELHMEENLLTGSVHESWNEQNFPSLEEFSLHGNNLTGNMSSGFCDSDQVDISISADCLGDDPEVECSCCLECW